MSLAQQAPNPNPTTPVYGNDMEWLTAYLTIHKLSANSRRYAYIFWFVIAAAFLFFTVLHLTGARGGTLGAYWSRWAIRRHTWRGKARRAGGKGSPPISLPPNGQLFALGLLPIATWLLCFAGPDYIAPSTHIFDVTNPGVRVRSYDPSSYFQWQPQYTIDKAWWTVGGRAGVIAFSLLPLCVLYALKAPPFAVFALPFTTQLHFDKLAWLHRWSGRLIYLVTLFHIVFWSIQLLRDRRPREDVMVYTYIWHYSKFIYGWVAFGLMTLIMVLSIAPIRKNHYEAFYALHVLLIPLMLITAALHHPPVAIWCWIALALWISERVWRGVWWLYINGIFGKDAPSSAPKTPMVQSKSESLRPSEYEEPGGYPPPSPFLSDEYSHASQLLKLTSALKYTPPPGFAHAELLSGATVRLTFVSPRFFSWAAGQHFLINIPAVSRVLSHPFTTASISDEQAPSDSARAMVFLIRSRGGWTRDLWDYVLQLVGTGEKGAPGETLPDGTIVPDDGVLLRMFVDGPFGSAVRAKWDSHATVVIFVAGSGVSFGLSVLQYVSLCLAGRDGKYLGGRAGGWGKKGFATRRVRFVWLIREFGHIQWCASIVRRCMEMIPAPGLVVDIFVTNALPNPSTSHAPRMSVITSELLPPMPGFALESAMDRPASQHTRQSIDSAAGSESDDDDIDISYGDFDDEVDITAADDDEDYALDLTNFDGDNDFTLPGEALLNMRVQRVGRDRRAHSRRFSSAITDKQMAEFSRTMSRTSVHSTEGLLAQPWKPAQSSRLKRMSLMSVAEDEGDVGNAHLTPGYHEDIPRPPTPELSPITTATIHALPPARPRPPRQPVVTPGFGRLSAFISPVTSRASMIFNPQKQPPQPTTPTLSRLLAASSTMISPVAESVASLAATTITMPDGSKAHGLHLHQDEMKDISFVAERARPGKPKLTRILKDEVDRANGSVIVACCGPGSFSSMVRKAVSLQIDPVRIRKGDRRGNVDLVSEEFEY